MAQAKCFLLGTKIMSCRNHTATLQGRLTPQWMIFREIIRVKKFIWFVRGAELSSSLEGKEPSSVALDTSRGWIEIEQIFSAMASGGC